MDDTRPIMILSYLTKILEKALKAKLEKSNCELLQNGQNQSWFKTENLIIVIKKSLVLNKTRTKEKFTLQ